MIYIEQQTLTTVERRFNPLDLRKNVVISTANPEKVIKPRFK